jgi:hypothetical protein
MNLVVCRVGCLFICLAILLIKLQNDELTFMAVWLGGDSQAWTEEGDKIYIFYRDSVCIELIF